MKIQSRNDKDLDIALLQTEVESWKQAFNQITNDSVRRELRLDHVRALLDQYIMQMHAHKAKVIEFDVSALTDLRNRI